MPVNYAELAKRLGGTPADTQADFEAPAEERVSFESLNEKYGDEDVSVVDASVTPTVQTGAPKKPGGFFAGVARAVAPLGESIGTALAGRGAKKMEAETTKRGEELANVAISLIRNPKLSAEQKSRALRAMQISKDAGVIGQSGAFEETAAQTFGKALSTLGAVTAGAGASAAAKLGLKGGAGLAARTGAEALAGGTTFGLGGGLQEEKRGGELAKSALTGAVASAVFGVAGEGLGAAAKFLSEKVPSRTINAILRTKASDFNFGKNPGSQVVEEGIVANTRGGFLKKINDRRTQVGQEIGAVLQEASSQGKTVDFRKALEPIQRAKAEAVKRGERALYQRLKDLEDGMTGVFAEMNGGIERVGTKNLHRLTPEQGRLMKTELGESTKWSTDVLDRDVNAIKVAVYRAMDGIIDVAVPAVEKLNDRYANLLTAEKALEKSLRTTEGQNLLRLNTVLTGLGVAGGAATGEGVEDRALRGLAGAGIAGALRSPATLTRLAQLARRAGPPTSLGGKATIQGLKSLALSSLQSGLK